MIAIIDSGVGNVKSVANALAFLQVTHTITSDPKEITKAEKLIFPGQGSFCDGMKGVHRGNLLKTLAHQVLSKGKLYLGICLGLQLLAQNGFEDGEYEGFAWIPGKVRKIDTNEKLPHIGWNNISLSKKSSLFDHLPESPTFYFAHSYVLELDDSSIATSNCEYGEKFVSSIEHKNIFGVQFHPEKSQKNGLQLLKNFAAL